MGKSHEAADAWLDYLSVQMKPTNDLFERIAVNRIKAGEKEKALNDCSTMELLQGRKEYQDICKAYLYRASGDEKEAMSLAEEALAIDKDNRDARQLLETLKK